MTLEGLVVLILVAALVGAIGQSLVGFSRGGCIASIVVGFIGAYLGTWLAGQLNLPQVFVLDIQGQTFPVLWAILGSAIFAGILSLLAGRRAYY